MAASSSALLQSLLLLLAATLSLGFLTPPSKGLVNRNPTCLTPTSTVLRPCGHVPSLAVSLPVPLDPSDDDANRRTNSFEVDQAKWHPKALVRRGLAFLARLRGATLPQLPLPQLRLRHRPSLPVRLSSSALGAWRAALLLLVAGLVAGRKAAMAMGMPAIPADGPPPQSILTPWQRVIVWSILFVISSAFHAAETSITTLYPWKVKQFAAEEGPTSPFRVLDKDITRVLTTILVATTACTIYSAAIFTNLATELLGARGVAYATVGLTAFTLIFGELIPKSLGVSNAELVARTMVPPINLLAVVLSPVGKVLSWFAKLFLRLVGITTEDGGRVSEEELRLLVAGAQKSGGIEKQEGQMINSVLNMQNTKVEEAMRPRVDVSALDKSSPLRKLQDMFQKTKYSRIPVFDGEIDKIIGVAMSKDLLEYLFDKDPDELNDTTVEAIMQPTYFVPESMPLWSCFQEMRQRRNHMAIVVDEYGGTAGIITLEDIQEEVFGEIYDEEDDELDQQGEDLITPIDDKNFIIQGQAQLEDVFDVLNMEDEGDEKAGFSTFSGYLCNLAGEIPAVSDHIVVHNYIFTITQADERRILEVRAERIDEDGSESADGSETDDSDYSDNERGGDASDDEGKG